MVTTNVRVGVSVERRNLLLTLMHRFCCCDLPCRAFEIWWHAQRIPNHAPETRHVCTTVDFLSDVTQAVATNPIAFSLGCGLNFDRGLSLLLHLPLLNQFECFAALVSPFPGCSLAGRKLDAVLYQGTVGGVLIVGSCQVRRISVAHHSVGMAYQQHRVSCRRARKLAKRTIHTTRTPNGRHFA